MKKISYILVLLILVFTGCQATPNNQTDTTENNESTFNNTSTTTTNQETIKILSVAIGETLTLESNREYVFGQDILPGTYELTVAGDDGMVNSLTIEYNPDCGFVTTSKQSNYIAFDKVYDPSIFEDGSKLIFEGEFSSISLRYIDKKDTGFVLSDETRRAICREDA